MKEDKLKELLEKYYDGNTSPEEEMELKEYFAGDDIFQGYEAEKVIFRHYSASDKMPLPSGNFEMRIIQAIDELKKKRTKNIFRKRYIAVLSSAAIILIMIATYFILINEKKPSDTFSDPAIAYAETMKILNDVSIKLNKGTRALKPIIDISNNARKEIKSFDRSVSTIAEGLRKAGLSGEFNDK